MSAEAEEKAEALKAFEEWLDSPQGEAFCKYFLDESLKLMKKRSTAALIDEWRLD
jgi:hypothetical protein